MRRQRERGDVAGVGNGVGNGGADLEARCFGEEGQVPGAWKSAWLLD